MRLKKILAVSLICGLIFSSVPMEGYAKNVTDISEIQEESSLRESSLQKSRVQESTLQESTPQESSLQESSLQESDAKENKIDEKTDSVEVSEKSDEVKEDSSDASEKKDDNPGANSETTEPSEQQSENKDREETEDFAEEDLEINADEELVEEEGLALDETLEEGEEEPEDDDPLRERYEQQEEYDEDELIPISAMAQFFGEGSPIAMYATGLDDASVEKYDHGKYSSGYNISGGIDVSKYQGSIDWKKAKADGVEFAFIRVGYRGYGSSGSLNEDNRYQDNISGALEAGIPVGVYMFSQATSESEAVDEANYILSRIGKYDITLPVVMDFEFAYGEGGTPGRLVKANLSKSAASAVCNAFCKTVKAAGYEPMLYADYNMLTNHLNASAIDNNYKIWIARWNTYTGYSREYKVWQFTDKGTVDGISGAVDLDFGYNLIDYEVTLHANGGVFESGESITIGVKQGSSIAEALEKGIYANPEKEGMDFVGWSTNQQGPKNYDENAGVTKNGLELYAVWSESYNRQLEAVLAYRYNADSQPGSQSRENFSQEAVNVVDPGTMVALTTDINNAEIYYNIGSKLSEVEAPSPENGIRYTAPIRISEKMFIKAIAVKSGYRSSDISSFGFSVNDISANIGQVLEEDLPGDAGVLSREERIALIPDGFWCSPIAEQTFSGKAITPEFRVYFGKLRLEEKKDYTLSFANNTNVGTATINVTGRGGYAGACSTTFDILPRDISEEINSIAPIAVPYNEKKSQSPVFQLVVDGKKLALSKDYRIESIVKKADSELEEDEPCQACKDPGTYIFTVSATENSNYCGSGSFAFSIVDSGITLVSTLTINKIPNQVYADWMVSEDGETEVKPEIILTDRLKNKVDLSGFDITYKNHTAVGTATVTVSAKEENEDYVGSKTATFNIVGYPMGKVSALGTDPKTGNRVDISKLISCSYNGKPHMPMGSEGDVEDVPSDYDIELSYLVAKGETPIALTKGVDYSISYLNNVKKGTATIIFTGKGRFSGTLKKNFKITEFVPESVEALAGHLFVEYQDTDSVRDNIAEYEYVKGGLTPSIRVYYEPDGGVDEETSAPSENAVLLTPNADYTLRYNNNKAVAAYDEVNKQGKSIAPEIVITGKNSYKGSIVSRYTILQKNIAKMDMSVGDKVASNKVKQYAVVPVLTDPNTAKKLKLAAGTDYNKVLKYTYEEQVRISRLDPKTKKTTYAVVSKGTAVGDNDIVPAGTIIRVTAEGIKNYTGTISKTYAISSYDISKASVKIADQLYQGKPVLPDKSDITSISIKIGKDNVAIEPYEYEIVPGSYAKNNATGTGTLMLHGTGNLCGYKTVSFKITAQSMYYQVAFFANGGTGSMKTQNIAKANTSLSKNAYKKASYAFVGWNTEADGSGIPFEDMAKVAKIYPGKRLELYAQWKPVPYTISYQLNGGKNNEKNPEAYTVEDEISFEDAIPSEEQGKMRFAGWYLDSKLTKRIEKLDLGSKGNIVLYADWELDYEVISLNVESHTKEEVKAFVKLHPVSGSDSWKQEPSLKKPIHGGVLSDASITSAVNSVNNIRYMAGLNAAVTNNTEASKKAANAALINALNNKLDHYPDRPKALNGEEYNALYDSGYEGAGASNLMMASWDCGLKYCIINGWMEDSDSNNIDRLGHRRWVLYPAMSYIGFGKAVAANGYNYYAMYAHGGYMGNTHKRVAWPAQNTMSSYFDSDSAWSLSMGDVVTTGSNKIDIVIKNKKTGAKTKRKPLYLNNVNYGDPGCIIFVPKVSTAAGSEYQVSIYLHEYEQEIRYDVNFF